ncbi:hypothetical protein I4F81_003453 [Pyropia yezoensis]|uniref:Uncharacterized protein n=1 Tax=Pyropia yezoensis TaxID=2788 RepID=A0ACC3BSI0_PYRYE|nr:hypothetical protein I4F81_003453 [Neopyropia yezoensis]
MTCAACVPAFGPPAGPICICFFRRQQNGLTPPMHPPPPAVAAVSAGAADAAARGPMRPPTVGPLSPPLHLLQPAGTPLPPPLASRHLDRVVTAAARREGPPSPSTGGRAGVIPADRDGLCLRTGGPARGGGGGGGGRRRRGRGACVTRPEPGWTGEGEGVSRAPRRFGDGRGRREASASRARVRPFTRPPTRGSPAMGADALTLVSEDSVHFCSMPPCRCRTCTTRRDGTGQRRGTRSADRQRCVTPAGSTVVLPSPPS